MKQKRRSVFDKSQVPESAVYYSVEYEGYINHYTSFCRLYNADFKHIEDVDVIFTNAIKALQRIVRSEDSDRLELVAYDLEKINDNFYAVYKNSDTVHSLENMVKNLSIGTKGTC